MTGTKLEGKQMLPRRLTRIFWRTVTFLFLVGILVTLLMEKDRLPRFGPPSQDEYVRDRLTILEKTDPQAAVALQRLRDERSASDLAVAMRAAQHQSSNDISALRTLADRTKAGQTPYEVQLTTIARQTIDLSDEKQTEAFFQSHATACQMLAHDPTGESMAYYLDLLNRASKDSKAWRFVCNDPVALVLWPSLQNDNRAMQFYDSEREWLAEVLADLAPDNMGTAPKSREQSYAEAVRIAMQYDPLPRIAVRDMKLGTPAYTLFFAFGPLIKKAVNDYQLPLDEVLDILFINGDGFGLPATEPLRSERASQFASQLVQIRKSRPTVWKAARRHPLALRLNRDVPNNADQLLEKYAANEVCAFLYTNYEQEIVPASAALAHYGDLGFYILKKYQDEPRLKSYLKDNRVGLLVVPFLARFGNPGFDKLHEDTAWVQRYFNSDGTPKKDDWEWIQSVPIIGAPTYLVQNLVKGNPSEWSEWGWAAFDVVDGALLIASFGTSAEVTAAKGVVKEGGKTTLENLSKQESKRLARTTAAEAASEGRTAWKGASALRRFSESGGRLVRTTGEMVLFAGRGIGKLAEPAFAGTRRLRQVWDSLPAGTKRWTYRSLLAVGMIITIHERTIPNLPKVGEAIGEEVGRFVRETKEAMANALTAAIRKTFGQTSVIAVIANWVPYGMLCLLIILAAWHFAPWRRSAVQTI